MLTEIVRLPVADGGAEPLLDFMRGHEYFQQDAVLSASLFSHRDGGEVMVIIEWSSPEAMEEAQETVVTQRFRTAIGPLLAGAPDLNFYNPED